MNYDFEKIALTEYEYALFLHAQLISKKSGLPMSTYLKDNGGALIPNPIHADAMLLSRLAYESAHINKPKGSERT
jgi:hypothetical protein